MEGSFWIVRTGRKESRVVDINQERPQFLVKTSRLYDFQYKGQTYSLEEFVELVRSSSSF
jgi:hypothetical protein